MTYQTQTLSQMKNNLKTLNPMELQELDDIITPRAADLLAKAFGMGIYDLLAPLTEDDALDEEAARMEGKDQMEALDAQDGLGDFGEFTNTANSLRNGIQNSGGGSEEGLRRLMREMTCQVSLIPVLR